MERGPPRTLVSCAIVPDLWNRLEVSDGYLVTLREARRSRQTPNAGLYQLTVERQSVHATGELTLVTMVGGENVYIDTMPETFIGAVAPAGPL